MRRKRGIILIVALLIVLVALYVAVFHSKNHKVAVLCYHNLATKEEMANFQDEKDWTIDVTNFEKQLQYLQKQHYKTLTMDEFHRWKKGELEVPYKSVLITFDDGFLSNYHYAFPLLKKYNMNATVFLIGKSVDLATQEEWDGNIKTYMPMSLVEKSKEEYPNIDFCSHSYGLHEQNALRENSINDMKDDDTIFQQLIVKTNVFAYPFGSYNQAITEALKEKDYVMAFRYGPTKQDYKKASRNDDNYAISRLNVSHGMAIWKFGLRLWLPN